MRWLHNIAFSSTTAPATSAPSSSSSSSAAAGDSDEAYSVSRHKSNNHHPHYYHLRNFRFIGGGVPRLMRQRKLRHLTDNELVAARGAKTASDSVESIVLSRSPSCSSAAPSASRMSTSVRTPVPMPLPLPLPENSNAGDGELRLPSPRDVFRERTVDGAGDGVSPISRDTTRKNSAVSPELSKAVSPELSKENPRAKFWVDVPIRSAPTSPFASPVLSRQMKSTADFLPCYNIFGKSNQVWSAPEMATVDIPGLPPPAFFDYTTFSTESSPLHSPPNISPRWNHRSPPGPASPLSTKLSIENSRRDSNASIEVHPLPLPPGAPIPPPSASVPQVATKQESIPMQCQWQKGKLIGRGTFGSVYVASNRETGALCAMKEVELFPDDPNSAECMKQLEQEIKVLSQLKHPNIVQYYGSEIVGDRFYIYLEYVHPGSINKYAREHCGAITESVVRSFTRHILSGLAYLHSMKTIHRDIKGANLLVDASGVVKLADFGMAKHLTGQAADLSLKGSPHWMAPELLQAVMQKDATSDLALAVDIWSLGCTIVEMFNGKPPWSEYEGAAAMFKVLRDTPPIPDTLTPEGKDFLRCCFRRNPAERPSASMLLEHRWLKNSQNLDVQSSNSSINGTKLMDMYYSPRSSEVKLDQLPILPSSQSTKAKMPSDSESGQRYLQEASNITVTETTRYSPRSILEVLPTVSPLHSGHNPNNSSSSSSIPSSLKHVAKFCPAYR